MHRFEPPSLSGDIAHAYGSATLPPSAWNAPPSTSTPRSPPIHDDVALLNKRARLCGLPVPADMFREHRRSASSRRACQAANDVNHAAMRGDWRLLARALDAWPDADATALGKLAALCVAEGSWQCVALLLQHARRVALDDALRISVDAARRASVLGPCVSATQLSRQLCCMWLTAAYAASQQAPLDCVLEPAADLEHVVDRDDLVGLVCAVLAANNDRLADVSVHFKSARTRLLRRNGVEHGEADMATVNAARRKRSFVTPPDCQPGWHDTPRLAPEVEDMAPQLVDAALNHNKATLSEYAVMISADKCAQFLVELQAGRLLL